MKRILIALHFILALTTLFAQHDNITRYQIDPAGYSTPVASNMTLNFTIGEMFTGTLTNGTHKLKQGYEQPDPKLFNIDITTICAGQSVRLLVYPAAGTTYQWQRDGVNITNANDSVIVTGIAGNYRVIVYNGWLVDTTNAIPLVFHGLPAVTVSNTGPYTDGNTIQLNSSGGASYIWVGPNGFTSQQQNPSITTATGADSGIYLVTATDTFGCSDTASTLVIVKPTTAVNNIADPQFTVYVTQGTLIFNFETPVTEPQNITIFNTLGQVISRDVCNQNVFIKNLSFLAPQMLLVSLGSGNKVYSKEIFYHP